MKKILFGFIVTVFIIAGAIYVSPKSGECEDCKQGKQCSTSYDCGEIGVCYCQYSYETEQETGGGIPDFGTCYFEQIVVLIYSFVANLLQQHQIPLMRAVHPSPQVLYRQELYFADTH